MGSASAAERQHTAQPGCARGEVPSCRVLPATVGAEPYLRLGCAGSHALAAEVSPAPPAPQLLGAGHPLPWGAQAGGSAPWEELGKMPHGWGCWHRGVLGLFQGESSHVMLLWCRGLPKGRREKPASALRAVMERCQAQAQVPRLVPVMLAAEPALWHGDMRTGAGCPGGCQPMQPIARRQRGLG